MKKKIAVLAGDGIGPEVMKEALCVLQKVACIFGHSFDLEHALVGGCAFDRYNCHLPEDTIAICQKSDAILFGSVGGPVELANDPKWLDCERNSILAMRKHFQFAVNFRPIKVYRQLSGLSPLKDNVVGMGVDLLVVRELVGDCYFGKHEISVSQAGRLATDESSYTEAQIRTAAHAAFKAAQKRRSHVTSVDKANVLITSRLWREVVSEVAASYPDVEHLDMLVDNCAMQLVKNPSQFDVIVSSNMFGDILSDLAAALPGSLGLCASASLNQEGFGLYEPPGGSAQDIASQGIANPIAQILSAALMLRYSFDLKEEAEAIENAVEQTLANGYRTHDIKTGAEKERIVSTAEIAEAIIQELEASTIAKKPITNSTI